MNAKQWCEQHGIQVGTVIRAFANGLGGEYEITAIGDGKVMLNGEMSGEFAHCVERLSECTIEIVSQTVIQGSVTEHDGD